MLKQAAAVAGLLLCCAVSASAGEVGDAANQAETLASDGKPVDAVVAMDEAVGRLWDRLPLTFLVTDFVTGRPGGYGNYDVRPDSRFKAGEQMLVYAELAGYGYGRDGDLFVINIAVDVKLRNGDGKVVGGQANFATLSYRSHVPNREFFATIPYKFTGLTAGTYTVVTTLRDNNSKKSGTFELPFTIE